ncbi:nitrite reductase small subunit NirD [Psychromonas algicola]|uniref:nitrite reductase small subunit NirD n=1 Tax=Psychromonas algicola TaxID=2555642 RepID=UPI001068AADF|nr:nitrite reductase small subunit NirD [Psychromonas sp. RZ5]TEW50692.1 nitrite reductase small subunit NirD [Psychromonas sp. RZ5]
MEIQSTNTTWTDICSINDLTPNAGICALFNEQQVAIFLCKQTNNVYAVANHDPFGQANVLSRGLMGSTEETVYVASPLYKQRFNLVTGECLDSDKEEHKLKTFAIRIENEQVQLKEAS